MKLNNQSPLHCNPNSYNYKVRLFDAAYNDVVISMLDKNNTEMTVYFFNISRYSVFHAIT